MSAGGPTLGRAFLPFFVLTLAWFGGTVLLNRPVYPAHLYRSAIWWGLIVMTIAAALYAMLDAARPEPGWVKRDVALNTLLFVALLAVMLDGLHGFRVLTLRQAGWIAFGAAAAHPLITDLPHHRHARAGDEIPVPLYIPAVCLLVDWTLAALLLVVLVLL